MLQYLFEPMKTNSGKQAVSVASKILRGLPHSHTRQVTCHPRLGSWAVAHFTNTVIFRVYSRLSIWSHLLINEHGLLSETSSFRQLTQATGSLGRLQTADCRLQTARRCAKLLTLCTYQYLGSCTQINNLQ
jgi:hypothetical protein